MGWRGNLPPPPPPPRQNDCAQGEDLVRGSRLASRVCVKSLPVNDPADSRVFIDEELQLFGVSAATAANRQPHTHAHTHRATAVGSARQTDWFHRDPRQKL